MKIWLTYYSASSLISQGLGNVEVWFTMPHYHFYYRDLNLDLPFGDADDKSHGIVNSGWEVAFKRSKPDRSLKFGELFGYIDDPDPNISELAAYVWSKLEEHFQEKDLRKWGKQEKAGIGLPHKFRLEIDLSIKMLKLAK